MVELVKNRVTSYKQLPINLYQINTKFRDEARPRFGLLRGREFLMKDGYSFHSTKEDMQREFALMEETYKKIFKALELDFRVVEADSGAIGGSGSKEFMALADSGEDTLVVCSSCEYGANIEAATRKPRNIKDTPEALFSRFNTPSVKSIDELASFFKTDKKHFIKAIIKKAIYDDGENIVVFFIRGDDDLQEVKAVNAIKANELVDISEDEIIKAGLVAGFVGPIKLSSDTLFVVDSELRGGSGLICGANEVDYHFVGVELNAIQEDRYADIVCTKEGDLCFECEASLLYKKGIEIGHIFQLADRYSKPLNANFLDENGRQKPFYMGTYGIGVSRIMAAIVEQKNDTKGCIWGKNTAPFTVDIIVSNIKDEEQVEVANSVYEALKLKNISVILDDRKERFGAKISDFELIGFFCAIIIGGNLKDGIVQLVARDDLQKIDIPLGDITSRVLELIK
jgi:prolyl-tRNA synthetase